MKELVRFEIQNGEDRSNLLSILGTHGYPSMIEIEETKYYSGRNKYFVVVYEKEKK